MLNAGTDWLHQQVRHWTNDREYVKVGEFLKDPNVCNDCAECCIKDITEYADAAQDSAHCENILIVANDHRDVFQELRKDALARMNVI